MEFAKIWPLTCHNRVKYWPRTKNNTTNREYSARAICWSFPQSSTTLRLETPRGGGSHPPPTPAKVVKHGLRARVKVFGLVTSVALRFLLYHTGFTADDLLRTTSACYRLGYCYVLFNCVYKPKCKETSLEISPMLRHGDLFFGQLSTLNYNIFWLRNLRVFWLILWCISMTGTYLGHLNSNLNVKVG